MSVRSFVSLILACLFSLPLHSLSLVIFISHDATSTQQFLSASSIYSTTMSSTNNDNSYLRHMESDVDQMLLGGDAVSGASGSGSSLTTQTNATMTLQEDSSGMNTAMETNHDDDDDNHHHNMLPPHPLPTKKTTAESSSPELEAMIAGLRQELDAVIQVNKVETDRMFDEMVVFLEDSHAICTDTMLGHLDFEQTEANRLTGMEPDVDAATVSLVGNRHGRGHHM